MDPAEQHRQDRRELDAWYDMAFQQAAAEGKDMKLVIEQLEKELRRRCQQIIQRYLEQRGT